jgi:hypothetical protein
LSFRIINQLVAAFFLLSACTKPSSSIHSLPAFASEIARINAEQSSTSKVIRIKVDFAGTLIFASPYAVSGNQQRITVALGPQVTEKLLKTTRRSSEKFHIFLVSTHSQIRTYVWDPPPVAFNDLFILNCQAEDYVICVIRNNVLQSVAIERGVETAPSPPLSTRNDK